jgi:hypothetical protein
MAAPYTTAFLTNASRELWPHVLESVLAAAIERQGPRFITFSFKPDSNPPRYSTRPSRDDPMSRYADWMSPAKAPYLSDREAIEFFRDASKPKYAELIEEKRLVLVVSPRDLALADTCVDSISFFVTKDQSSIPFVFEAIRAIRPGAPTPPAWMTIVGERRLEDAASFFASCKGELRGPEGDDLDLSFAGCIDFDRDELDLAATYGRPFLEAFPMGVTHGQAKLIAGRIFASDPSAPSVEQGEKAGALLSLAEKLGAGAR